MELSTNSSTEGSLYNLLLNYTNEKTPSLTTTELTTHLLAVSTEQRCSILKSKFDGGWTFLHRVVRRKDTELVKCLFSHLTVQDRVELLMIQDENGYTQLHVAVHTLTPSIDIVSCMLDSMTAEDAYKLLKMQDNDGWTPQHLASIWFDVDILKRILDSVTEDRRYELLTMQCEEGETVLHKVCWSGSAKVDTIACILNSLTTPEQGHNLHMIQDKKGMTALRTATQEGRSIDNLTYIIDSITPENRHTVFKVQDNKGMTPLHYAIGRSRFGVTMKYMLDAIPVENRYKVLVVQDKEGRTSLHHAASSTSVSKTTITHLLQKLTKLQRTQFLNIRDKEDKTDLDVAKDIHCQSAVVLLRKYLPSAGEDPTPAAISAPQDDLEGDEEEPSQERSRTPSDEAEDETETAVNQPHQEYQDISQLSTTETTSNILVPSSSSSLFTPILQHHQQSDLTVPLSSTSTDPMNTRVSAQASSVAPWTGLTVPDSNFPSRPVNYLSSDLSSNYPPYPSTSVSDTPQLPVPSSASVQHPFTPPISSYSSLPNQSSVHVQPILQEQPTFTLHPEPATFSDTHPSASTNQMAPTFSDRRRGRTSPDADEEKTETSQNQPQLEYQDIPQPSTAEPNFNFLVEISSPFQAIASAPHDGARVSSSPPSELLSSLSSTAEKLTIYDNPQKFSTEPAPYARQYTSTPLTWQLNNISSPNSITSPGSVRATPVSPTSNLSTPTPYQNIRLQQMSYSPTNLVSTLTTFRDQTPTSSSHTSAFAPCSKAATSSGTHPPASTNQMALFLSNQLTGERFTSSDAEDLPAIAGTKRNAPIDLSNQQMYGPTPPQLNRYESAIEGETIKLICNGKRYLVMFQPKQTVGEFTKQVQDTTGHMCTICTTDGYQCAESVLLKTLPVPFTISAGSTENLVTSRPELTDTTIPITSRGTTEETSTQNRRMRFGRMSSAVQVVELLTFVHEQVINGKTTNAALKLAGKDGKTIDRFRNIYYLHVTNREKLDELNEDWERNGKLGALPGLDEKARKEIDWNLLEQLAREGKATLFGGINKYE